MKRRRVRKEEGQEKEEGEEEEWKRKREDSDSFVMAVTLWLQNRPHLPKTKPWVPMSQVLQFCCAHTRLAKTQVAPAFLWRWRSLAEESGIWV